jgi:predicted dehydrogenase
VKTSIKKLPTYIPGGVLASRGQPGANDRVVTAVIGCGGMGQHHVYPDCAALCNVDANHLANAAKRITKGTPFLTKDYRSILDRKDIDAVFIGTPDHWHALMTVHACQAGKDVYCEKPTCRTIQEGRAMINAARHYKRVIQIGAQGRSNPEARAAAQYVRNGQLGRVRYVEVWHEPNWTGEWGEEKPVPPELDWDLWLGPARWIPYNPIRCHFNFRWFMDFGGGFIRDRGNHVLSIVLWAMGDNAQPVSVEATGAPPEDGLFDTPVTMSVKWEFKNPDWTLTWEQPGTRHKLPGSNNEIPWGAKFHGDRDTLIMSGGDGGCETEPKAQNYRPPGNGVTLPLHPIDTDPTERHRQNFLHCVRTREKPVMDVETGVQVITLGILGNIAYRLGRKLRWDPKKQQFMSDEEANRFLSEPYRAPWRLS